MIKPFHELTHEEFAELINSKPDTTWAECAEMYPQPEWCSYIDAVCGEMGCWSLMAYRVTGPEFCQDCFAYKPLSQEDRL